MKNIKIIDVSLKDYKKSGITLSFKEKLEIARNLCELGVDVLELSSLIADKSDEVLIKTVCALVNKSTVSCLAGNTIESVEKTYSLISGAKKKRLLISIPVSPVQMEYYTSKKPKAVIELLATLTEKAASLCSEVEVSLEDSTRAEKGFLYQAIKTAIVSGAKVITVNDIAGVMLPEEFCSFISELYQNVPELSSVELNVECSNTFSLATASYITVINCGAIGVKLSALGVSSLPEIENFASVIDVVGAKNGISCGINKTAIHRTVGRIKQMANHVRETVLDNVIGDTAENLNKNITQNALGKLIKKLGYDLSAEDLTKVYAEFKNLSNRKEVNTKELDVVIASVALQVPATYTLDSFVVNSSNVLSATASIVLVKDGEKISGLSYGNGAVDASFMALEKVIGRHFELDDFAISAVTEGKEAMGEAVVKLRANGKIYSGRGVSTDVIGASIRAYVNAVNKVVYEENN